MQVKRRGFRIEPAAIEEALRGDPQVRDAAVVAEGGGAEDRILVAYLAASVGPDATDLISGIRARLRDRLPEYLIPDRWAMLDSLPLNANGKVDRRALSDASLERVDAPTGTVPAGAEPVGEIESTLAAIWRELFKLPRIGRHDDFFELGGHSLLASLMAARIRNAMGIEVPLEVIFDHPTVADMAVLIERA